MVTKAYLWRAEDNLRDSDLSHRGASGDGTPVRLANKHLYQPSHLAYSQFCLLLAAFMSVSFASQVTPVMLRSFSSFLRFVVLVLR